MTRVSTTPSATRTEDPSNPEPKERKRYANIRAVERKEQDAAEEKALVPILEAVIEGALRFSDEKNEDDLQARIDRALEASEENRTPWFAHEFLLEDEKVSNDLKGMARCDAEDALYPTADETIIRL